MKNKYPVSTLDDQIEEKEIQNGAKVAAIKRVIAYQIVVGMKQAKLSKSAMACKMRTSRSALDRLLDPSNVSVTLQTLEKAAIALGKSLKVELA